MLPRFITELENDYNKKFPGNPATLFYPDEEKEKPFRELLRQAIDRGEGLRKEELIVFFGEQSYQEFKEYLEEWGGPITWPSK